MARLQDIEPTMERARVVEAVRALGLDPHKVKSISMDALGVVVSEWTDTDENGDGVLTFNGVARIYETYFRVVD